MTLREHAAQLTLEEIEAIETCRAINGLPEDGEQPREGTRKRIRRQVLTRLRNTRNDDGSRKYGSIELWLFAITTLGKIILLAWKIWRERRNSGEIGHA